MAESIQALKQLLDALEGNPSLLSELNALVGAPQKHIPTVDEWVATCQSSYSDGSLRGYLPYWRLLAEHHGHRRLNEITVADLSILLKSLSKPRYVEHRSFRGGDAAKRHAVQGWRSFFRKAEKDGYVTKNPALELDVPRRANNIRRGLTRDEVQKLFNFVSTTGYDPELDALILRFAFETGCRRGGLLTMQVEDINQSRQSVMVLEKNNKKRELPVTKELMHSLLQHNYQRGDGKGNVLRYKNSKPLTKRRLDSLFDRVKANPPFEGAENISLHWCRHTAGSWVERVSSEAISANYLGHQPTWSSVTGLYTAAMKVETIRAWCQVWDCDHPLAHEG